MSAALVGVFALPAYAAPVGEQEVAPAVYAQALSTSQLAELAVPDELPTAEQEPLRVVVSASRTAEAALESAGARGSYGWSADISGSSLGSSIANAALGELGVNQDCTDLVQNALAAVGLATRRDQGGYDEGPWSLASKGVPVTDGQWAPGDILGWPGYPHVAIYIGDGLAVHGGMGGTTVVGSATGYFGTPTYVVRPS